MDTRRATGFGNTFRPVTPFGTDTVPTYPDKLVQVRFIDTSRGAQGLRAIVSTISVIAVLTIIVVFAIASSMGFSVLDPWSG